MVTSVTATAIITGTPPNPSPDISEMSGSRRWQE
jgi:hypothetical protein